MPSYYRFDSFIINPVGLAIPGASIAVLQQPANFSTQPGTPLQAIYAANTSNSATITNAFWNGGTIAFTFSTTPPADVITGSYIGVSGVTPSSFNTTLSQPYLVLSVIGNLVTVVSLASPGTYVSGGTVATSVLPNPLSSDGNGNFFFYAAPGIYSVQIYDPSITERDLVDQAVGSAAGGSVTSVALTMPGIFSVAGSPITSTGTLAVSLATETANTVWAGPATGGSAIPTFRALVAADLPDDFGTVTSVALSATFPAIFNVLIAGSPITTSGTISETITLATQSANTVWSGPSSGVPSAPSFRALAIADLPFSGTANNTTFARGDGTWATGTSSGGVTSVGMTGDGVVFNTSVSGSPVTGFGTFAPSLHTQSANLVFAGPTTGSAVAPAFRALVAADLPSGLGLNWSNGEVPTGSGTAFALVHAPNGLILGFRNVSPMIQGTDFTISGANITLSRTIGSDTLSFWYTY